MSRVVVVTGASSGIGAVAARELAHRGFEVAVVGRNPERTGRVAEEVGGRGFLVDYDDLASVRRLADELAESFPRIDVLANNAGGMLSQRGTSVDGFERTFQHNHLAPFLLTTLLAERTSLGRVIGTASVANTFGDLRLDDLQWEHRPWRGGWRAYGTSKIATILFARELAARGVDAYSFHPGYVATSFGHENRFVRLGTRTVGLLALTPEQGAQPLVELASADRVGAPSGTYFDRLKPFGRVHRSANREGAGAALWAASADLVGVPAA